jgi:hypothetical protein
MLDDEEMEPGMNFNVAMSDRAKALAELAGSHVPWGAAPGSPPKKRPASAARSKKATSSQG